MKAPRITHFPAREWNVRAQLRSETSTSIRLPIVSSTDRGRFHPYLPVQSGLPATAPSSAPPTQDVDVGATSHTLDAAPPQNGTPDPRGESSKVEDRGLTTREGTPPLASGSLTDPIEVFDDSPLVACQLSEELGGADSQSLAQSADLESETDRREQRPVQVKIDDNLQFGGQPTAEVAVETGDAPVLPDNSNQTEPATHIPNPLNHPVVKKFGGAGSGHTYVWYPSEGEYDLEYPPPIPRGATGDIPAGAIFRHVNTRSGHIQRWVRERPHNDGQRWAELNEGQSYTFDHGTYVLSHNRTVPSWVTPESLRKKRYATAQSGPKR